MAGPNSIGEALGCAKSFGRLSNCLAEWKKDATPAVTASAPDSGQSGPATSVLTGGNLPRYRDASTVGDYGDPQNAERMKELEQRQQRNRSSPGFG